MLNEWAYARVIEELANVEVPEYARVVRTMSAELSRILSHFLFTAMYALDVSGEFNATFIYGFRDRELVQDLLEGLTGQRLMFNYFRVGGVAWDSPNRAPTSWKPCAPSPTICRRSSRSTTTC